MRIDLQRAASVVFALAVTAFVIATFLDLRPCDEERGPLETLQCPLPVESFDVTFWLAQAKDETDLWSTARALCSETGWPIATRCEFVRRAALLSGLEKAAAETRKRLQEGTNADPGLTGLPPGLELEPPSPPLPESSHGDPVDRRP